MREILFRGKSEESGEWLYGLPDDEHHNADFPCILPDWRIHSVNDVPDSWEVDPKTVGQFTGLTDKKGKKIFEGDIVERPCYCAWPYHLKRCVIAYGKDGFEARDHIGGLDSDYYTYRVIVSKDCVVIGNIHDNPELLKGD